MIDFKEIPDGETWELFSRDFLETMGFVIEEGPDRGPDMGRDMLVTERLTGYLGRHEFRWLISCKHYARSKKTKAVAEDDEQNIQERLNSLAADGFIGMYSTIASTNLNKRLGLLRRNGQIKDFRILDHKLIESHLISLGYSSLLMRYFPNSYRILKPLHRLWGEYIPLQCEICGKDLLEDLYKHQFRSVILMVERASKSTPGITRLESTHWACKGRCDQRLEDRFARQGKRAGWYDLQDLSIPALYLQRIFATMNRLRAGDTYSDQAFEREKDLLLAMGQRVFREQTQEERMQARDTLELLKLGV